jgi:TfoX/Sxy family transcriptional regulator of competence genes
VAYDEGLAARLRDGFADTVDVTEQRMFGGLAFLVGGHMAIAASHDGGLLVRVDPAESETLVASTSATPMVMQGREMAGWLRVPAADVRTKRQLTRWLRLGAGYAGSLPPKPTKRRRPR